MKAGRRALVLLVVAGATGCSLLVGLGQDAVPIVADVAVDAPVQNYICPAGSGWQLDCSFGTGPGISFAHHAVGPGSVFTYDALDGLYVGAINQQGALRTVVQAYQTDGAPSGTQIVFDGGALEEFATTVMSFPAAAAILTSDLDAAEQSLSVQVYETEFFPPFDFGRVRIDRPEERPQPIGVDLDIASTSLTAYTSANFVVDGSVQPGAIGFGGGLFTAPHTIGVAYTGVDEPPDGGGRGASGPPYASPLARARVGIGLPSDAGIEFWVSGVTRADAGVAELFLDASASSPSLRIPLPFTPEAACLAAPGIVFGRTSTGVALQDLPYPLTATATFGELADYPPMATIAVPEVATLSTLQAASDGVRAVTVMGLAPDATLVAAQWVTDAGEAGLDRATFHANAAFGEGGVLRVSLPTGTTLGTMTYYLGAYYFTVQLANGDDALLRLVDPDGGM